MKKRTMRGLALALAACAVMTLAACGGVSRTDATDYIQGELDASYKGVYNESYLKVLDITEDEAKETFETNVSAEARYLLDFFYVESTDEEVLARAEEVVTEIYSHAKYTVGKADKLQSGDFAVEVTLSPIEIIPLLTDDMYMECIDLALADAGVADDAEELTDDQITQADSALGLRVLEKLEALIPELTYGTDQTVMMQLKEEDNVYTLVETGWQKLDEMMIDYNGAYT